MFLVQPSQEQQVIIREAFNENPKTRDEDLRRIKEWLREQPHLPDSWDDHGLLMFLRGCRFCPETCKYKLEKYFTYRTTFPEFFADRDIRNPELEAIKEIVDAAVLADLTPSGCRVSIAKAAKPYFDTPNIADLMKIVFMVGDLRLRFEKTGVTDIYIADLNFPLLRHVFRVNPMTIKRLFMCIQDAYPVLIKEIHLINAPSYVGIMLSVIKPFMSEHLRNAIHVHSGVETLYDFVPKEILPEEYGGKAGKLPDLKQKWLKTLEENFEWFEREEGVKADLTKKRKQGANFKEVNSGLDNIFVD